MAETDKSNGLIQDDRFISLINRQNLTVTGVCDVISFDEQCIFLSTKDGILSVDGNEMHIVSLSVDVGKVEIQGKICGLIFPESNGRSPSFFRRKQK